MVATPQPGSIIHYSYLWADEHKRGFEEGRKDRPTLVLALAVSEHHGKTEVLAAAISHSPPARPSDAVELPVEVKRDLGLDDRASWIVTTEANVFFWPGPDVRPVPGRTPATVIYGRVPRNTLIRAIKSYLANRSRKHARLVVRSS
jgi:hypothetical protein